MSQAFKLLEDRERYQSWIEDTRQKVEVAVAELDSAEPTLRERGEGVELDLVLDRLQQKFQSAKENT